MRTSLTPSGSQPAIGDAIAAAEEIHNSMTVGQYNAYLWWWVADWNPGSGVTNYGLVDTNNNPTYYGYALAQFSKFVRPGAKRVSATASPASGVFVSAYEGASNSAIVAINSNGAAASLPVTIENLSVGSVTPFETTSAGGLMQQSAVAVTNGSFTYTLPAQSIVTFVASGSGTTGTGCTSPSAAPTGLAAAAATTYYYVVEAVDSDGTSAASSQASATTRSAGGSGSACTVNYTITPQTSSTFGATISIANSGTTALSNWTLTWSFANGQTISSSWNGTVAQSGANVTVSEQSGQTWENIPAGGSYTGFGFNGTWNGITNSIPTAFSLNGTACTVN